MEMAQVANFFLYKQSSNIVNNMAARGAATPGVRTSASMVLSSAWFHEYVVPRWISHLLYDIVYH